MQVSKKSVLDQIEFHVRQNGDECDDTRRHSSLSEPVSLSVDSSSEFEIDTPVEIEAAIERVQAIVMERIKALKVFPSEPSKNIANHFRVFDADDNHIYTHVTFVNPLDSPVEAVPASAVVAPRSLTPELSNRVLNISLHRKHMGSCPSLPFLGFSARSVRSILVRVRVRLPRSVRVIGQSVGAANVLSGWWYQ